MSSKSIRAYQERYGKPVALQDRIREHASTMRRRAASLLAQANELDDMANELQPGQPGEVEQPVPTCDCGSMLAFDPPNSTDERVCCWCPRCHKRSGQDGCVVFVYGYGRDKATALADWRARMDNF